MISLTLIHGSNDGNTAYAKGNSVNVRTSPDVNSPLLINVKSGTPAGTVLGEWSGRDERGFKWYAVKLSEPVEGRTTGSVREDVIIISGTGAAAAGSGSGNEEGAPLQTSTQNYQESVSRLVKKIAEIDVIIYKRLLVIFKQLKDAERLGVDVKAKWKVFEAVLIRYKRRQNILKTTENIKYVVPEYPLFSWITQKFGLGAIQIPAAVIITLVVISTLAIATAIQNAFSPEIKGQAEDLKITGEFKKFFDTLPEDKQKIIKAELQDQLNDAYEKGAKESGGLMNTLKWVAVGFLGLKILEYINDRQKRTQTVTQ